MVTGVGMVTELQVVPLTSLVWTLTPWSLIQRCGHWEDEHFMATGVGRATCPEMATPFDQDGDEHPMVTGMSLSVVKNEIYSRYSSGDGGNMFALWSH